MYRLRHQRLGVARFKCRSVLAPYASFELKIRVSLVQDGLFLQKLSRQPSCFGGKPHPLLVVQQEALVLLLLFLQDPDLLFEVFDGFPAFFVGAIGQTRHKRKPEVLFHSSARLTD